MNVLNLSWASLLNDIGSEVILRLVPFFVTGVLRAPMSVVGAIEGIAEATATFLKPLFGSWSDRLGKRKPFVVLGYSLSAFSRPLLILAASPLAVGIFRFFDRVGKGVRVAPRDALIASSSAHSQHGRSFAINRSLDTVGALIGVSAFALWFWKKGEIEMSWGSWRTLVLFCSIPGFLAVLLIILRVKEAEKLPKKLAEGVGRVALTPTIRRYLVTIGLFSFANSSDAFILLRAKELGFSLAGVLGVVALLNLVSALTAIPAAMLSDRLGRRALIALGWTIYAATYSVLGWLTPQKGAPWILVLTVAFYGLFFGFTESVEKAWIADLVPAELRGRAYGAFGFVTGAVAVPASFGFGYLWDHYGSAVPFLASGAVALFATSLLFAWMPSGRKI